MGPTVSEPLVTLVPLHPPLAVQLVAFVALHVSVVDPPLTTFVGLAVKDTTGGGCAALTVTVTDCGVVPPAPVQVSV